MYKRQDLNKFEAGTVVTQGTLEEAGMLKQVKDGIKVLGPVSYTHLDVYKRQV